MDKSNYVINTIDAPWNAELKAQLQKAIAQEKRNLKTRLRKAIKEKDYSFVHSFCLDQHPKWIKTQQDLILYGTGLQEIDMPYVLWIARYFRRLTGVPLYGKK